MRPNDLFNFHSLLTALTQHDWSTQPAVVLTGRPRSGKSRILEAFASSINNDDLIIYLDGEQIRSEEQLLTEAVACALTPSMLKNSRAALSPRALQINVSNSTITQSNLQVSQNNSRRFRRRPEQQESGSDRARSHISALIEDLEYVEDRSWVLVDHFDNTPDYLVQLVRGLARRMRRHDGLRIILAVQGAEDPRVFQELLSRSGLHDAALYPLGILTSENLAAWAHSLGLELSEDNINMLRDLSDGRAGEVWDLLMRLSIRSQYMDYAPESVLP